jgi:peptidoglycan/LPS O-acetylase OafA/YrhL
MALSCLLSAAVGLVVYALLERPMLNRLKPLVRNVSRAGAGGGAARQGPAD